MEKASAIGQSSMEYVPSPGNGSTVSEEGWEWNPQHRRAFSESFLILEQPSSLDELLDEPETPVREGSHRRSSSDTFVYTGVASLIDMGVARDSQIRKFRYIENELERKLQDRESEASELVAKLESLEEESLFLDMNNYVLKVSLESFEQELLVQHLKQEEIGREVARLRAFCAKQQQRQQSHRCG